MLLSNDQEDEECDARNDHQGIKAGKKKYNKQ